MNLIRMEYELLSTMYLNINSKHVNGNTLKHHHTETLMRGLGDPINRIN